MTQLVPDKGSIDLKDYILINAGVVSGRTRSCRSTSNDEEGAKNKIHNYQSVSEQIITVHYKP